MKYMYEPFILRRFAEGRVFFVNPDMPFEHFMSCFQFEQPFFLISQLEDRRIAITPNSQILPQYLLHTGFGLQELLPRDFEYVTLKDATYPVIITAHPVPDVDLWMNQFQRWVKSFSKQTLSDYVTTCRDFIPLKKETWKKEKFEEKVTV